MKLIIEIPEEMIKAIEQGNFGAKYTMYDLIGCVMNGTPPPEEHKKLGNIDMLPTKLDSAYAIWRRSWI